MREHGPEGTRWNVVAFDLSKETCQEVPQPNYDDGSFSLSNLDFFLQLVVVRGSLCLVRHYIRCCGSHTAVWIMKGDGVRNCWTKLVRFHSISATNDSESKVLAIPLLFKKW